MQSKVSIDVLMKESGVGFGTSGARGLVTAMTDHVCAAYTLGFLEHVRQSGCPIDVPLVLGGDLRPSTPRIMRAALFAAQRAGRRVEFAGFVPSPAVALRGFVLGAPSLMVTGSHIPDDRNGMKFNAPSGEITKDDERGIARQVVELPDAFDYQGALVAAPELGPADPRAGEAYRERYLQVFPEGCLRGLRLGVYGHSAVGRDDLVAIYEALGAEVVRVGYSDVFVPVDTEAVRIEDCAIAQAAVGQYALDAVVSTDGDSDRPLVFDETGRLVRGDVAGIITARFLGADAVATPVSCNTAVERSGFFQSVLRSRIGSPFVIEKMQEARHAGAIRIVGYEANGGFLLETDADIPGGERLPALPTRDAVIVHLALLLSARASGQKLSELVLSLPQRFTASGRDQSFATALSMQLFQRLRGMAPEEIAAGLSLGGIESVDETDGLRYAIVGGDIVHLRASGNAPELRCYAESDSPARAEELVNVGLDAARRWARG